MTEQLAWSLQIARSQTLALASDIPADLACRQSQAGERHPCWILGHLILADSYLLTLLNVAKLPPDFAEQLQKYGPGKTPTSTADHYDSPETLRDRLVQTGSQRVDAVRRYHAGQLSAWRRAHGLDAAKWVFAR